MKPNPDQAADRAAFDAWYSKEFSHVWHSQIGPEDTNHYEAQFDCWQDAKADSRAMQEVFEQVCAASAVLLDLNDNYAPFGGEIYRDAVDRSWDVLRTALSLAAPFRKTGV